MYTWAISVSDIQSLNLSDVDRRVIVHKFFLEQCTIDLSLSCTAITA